MRKLIPLMGIFFLVVTSVNKVNIEPEIPVTENGEGQKTRVTENRAGQKTRVIDWMGRHGRMPIETLEQIYEEAHKHALPDLLIAIAKVESEFDPGAVSRAGATGLTQVMIYVWGEELKRKGVIASEDDLFDIPKSMAAGAYILEKYLRWEGGDLEKALNRYVGTRSEMGYPKKVIETLGELSAIKYQKTESYH